MKDLTIITPSNWLKKEVEQSFLGIYDVVHIPNGINMDMFHPTHNKFRTYNGLKDKIIV